MATATASFTSGLTSAEVAQRVTQGQSNNFKTTIGRTYWQIVRDNIFNIFNVVLGVLFAIMLIQHDFTNVLLAGIAVGVNALLGLIQEIKAKRALDQLAMMALVEIDVWRDGIVTKVSIDQIVKDDVLPIKPGDHIVVDGRLLQADNLEVDESLLTGESDAVAKTMGSPVWSGSFCIAGTGLIVATAVGENSTMNKLSTVAKTYRITLTPTQQKINQLVGASLIAAIVLCPLLIVASLATHLSTLEIVRNAVVLVTSLIAQGMVLSTTLSLVLGAIRISRQKAVVRRINAIESMAHTNVLCFDKTGTLTCNQLILKEIHVLGGHAEKAVRRDLCRYISNLTYLNKTAAAIADGMGAFERETKSATKEIPYTSARRWGAVEFSDATFLLGAPESLLEPTTHREVLNTVNQFTVAGARVLVFARCESLPQADNLPSCEPLALFVLTDQIREDIQQTLETFYQQDVTVKVISGDNIETVRAIATHAGVHVTAAYTGDQLGAMSTRGFDDAVRAANLFARIAPDMKRQIIASLKRQGFYAAMVGDGVNDVPGLKEANLAIAMNDGAQIAKDVADVVLLNNALSTLPLAFSEGRTITQKIYSTARLFLVKNFCVVFLILAAFVLGLPFPTTPLQISWLTLVMINIPALLITIGVLRPIYLRNFQQDVLRYSVKAGLVGMFGGILIYGLSYLFPLDRDTARSGLFLFLGLFSIFVFLQTHGIDIMKLTPRRELSIALVLLCGTLLPALLFATTFNFVFPPTYLLIVVIGAFLGALLGMKVTLSA
jgi:cation-transporting ATPase E